MRNNLKDFRIIQLHIDKYLHSFLTKEIYYLSLNKVILIYFEIYTEISLFDYIFYKILFLANRVKTVLSRINIYSNII